MSDRTRCLLDKVTARRILEGLLKLAEGRDLGGDELFALDLFYRAGSHSIELFIVPPTVHTLSRLEVLPRYGGIIRLLRDRMQVALPARYFTRWSRRLRDFGFTPEDAAVLALGTFGTNESGTILGMDYIATFDQPLIRHWATQQGAIRERWQTMRDDLPAPYRDAPLPDVQPPEHIVIV